MAFNSSLLLVYAIFLLIILIINLLYIFQVFKYRLPGDASLGILFAHIALVLGVIILSSSIIAAHGFN